MSLIFIAEPTLLTYCLNKMNGGLTDENKKNRQETEFSKVNSFQPRKHSGR